MPLSIDDILMRHFLAALRPGPGDKFLDVGSGTGYVARAVARTGAWVAAVDADMPEGDPPWTKNAVRCAGNALELPFRERTFDAVTCRHAFHHVRELNRAFSELGRVLLPAGIAGVIDGIAPTSEKVSAFLHKAYDIRDRGTHVRFMTLTRWRELFRSAGLHLVRIEARLVMHDLDVWSRRGNGGEPATRASGSRAGGPGFNDKGVARVAGGAARPEGEPPADELRAHFESAPAVVRTGLKMVPAVGLPARFGTIDAVMIGRR